MIIFKKEPTMDFQSIIARFHTRGTVGETVPLGNGLINDTYRVNTVEPDAPDYVLQRINHEVFKDVDGMQKNIAAVTRHLRRKLQEQGEDDIDRKVLCFVDADTGKNYLEDEAGNYWRMSVFIPRTQTYEQVTPQNSYSAGRAFGRFQSMLTDLPETLCETIPGFHDMRLRLHQLRQAVTDNVAGRAAEVRSLIDELERRADHQCLPEQWHDQGLLPKRVCHCDTKVNNILFDENGEVLCVIDLDTVMPNFIFSDYGDFLRTAANTGKEDDLDLGHIGFDMDIFRSFTQGYLEGAGSFLLPVEHNNLSLAATRFPYMQCVRFLTDYLNGDTYYKTQYPTHNLVRARAQFRLLQCMERKSEEMRKFIEAYNEEH